MPDVFDFSSDESAGEMGSLSDPELPTARPKRPSKRGPSNQYCAWKCKHVLHCDLFYDESTDGLTLEEKTNLLKEHLRTQQGWPCQCSAQNVAAGAGPVAGGVGLAGGAGSGSFLVPATPTSTSSHHRFNCFSTPTSRNAAHSAIATLTQVKHIVWHIFMSNGFPIIYNTQLPSLCLAFIHY